jgi:dihydrofolate reductase
VDWSNSRLVKGDAGEEVARLKREDGKDLAIFGSNDLAASLAQSGLIDEYRFFVNPVILGGGTSVLSGVKDPLHLQLMSSKRLWDGVVLLTYAPA